mgnify:CR=1 FL=1
MDRPIAFACDRWEDAGCYLTYQTDYSDMKRARQEARRAGWLSTGPLDLCPKHKADHESEEQEQGR